MSQKLQICNCLCIGCKHLTKPAREISYQTESKRFIGCKYLTKPVREIYYQTESKCFIGCKYLTKPVREIYYQTELKSFIMYVSKIAIVFKLDANISQTS